jgi:drug/metabolite transporter (DMT)-like permease
MRISVATAARITLRALFLILSTYSFVSAVSFMPLADALAIAFIEPFILLILGHLLFHEPIGPRRIIACIIGFLGATLVIQPSLTAFGLRALWPLGTAVSFAAYVLSTRATAATTHPVTLQLHTSIAGSLILVPMIWLFEGTDLRSLDPVWPQGLFWIWLFGVGFWATLSHICVTYALKFAPASTTAQLHYSEIASSVLFGYLVFGDFPNRLAMLGITVIILAGFYVIYRERLVTRQNRGPAPQAPLTAD